MLGDHGEPSSICVLGVIWWQTKLRVLAYVLPLRCLPGAFCSGADELLVFLCSFIFFVFGPPPMMLRETILCAGDWTWVISSYLLCYCSAPTLYFFKDCRLALISSVSYNWDLENIVCILLCMLFSLSLFHFLLCIPALFTSYKALS